MVRYLKLEVELVSGLGDGQQVSRELQEQALAVHEDYGWGLRQLRVVLLYKLIYSSVTKVSMDNIKIWLKSVDNVEPRLKHP